MDRNVAEAIRQQSEDLREELKELEQWEDAVKSKEAARAQRKTTQGTTAAAAPAATVPPIRGTVPSLKEAVRQQQAAAGVSGGVASAAAVDPIQQAKDRGNAFFQAGKLQEAVAAYTVGIDLDPASATTHVLYANRAMCYLKLGQWTAAEKDATTCVQMNTGYAKAYYRRAMARKNLHKLREARADLEAVLALAPKDVSAQQEMEEVTKALQAERAAATASAPAVGATKKRIVIEEVDSEEDEEGEAGGDGAAAPPPPAAAPKISAEEAQLRQSRIDEDLKKLAAARAQQESQTRMEAQREAQVQAQRQRRNQRVEIIEEEEEEEEKKVEEKKPEVVKSAPAPAPASAPAPPQHVDPTPAPAPSKAPAPSPSPAPAAARPRPALSKENLTTPKSFTEFERRFRELQQAPELRIYYVSLLQPATLSKLFGSNMTADILLGILEAVRTFDGPTAFQFAKGLSQVNRVENTTMFFNAKEKAVVQEVVDLLRASSGASETDIAAIQRKLKPF